MSNIIEFPVRAPAELEMVERLKEVVYEFSGRVIIAQCIGCFDIAMREIRNEQP